MDDVFISIGDVSRNTIAGYKVCICLSLSVTDKLVSKSNLQSYQQCMNISLAPYPCPNLVF